MNEQPNTPTKERTLYCSFCGKSQHEVRKLIAGPTVFICDECTELCMDIIKEGRSTRKFRLPETHETVFGVMIPKSVLNDKNFSMKTVMTTIEISDEQSPHELSIQIGHAIIRSKRDQIIAAVDSDIEKALGLQEKLQTELNETGTAIDQQNSELVLAALQCLQSVGKLTESEKKQSDMIMSKLAGVVAHIAQMQTLGETLAALRKYKLFVEELR